MPETFASNYNDNILPFCGKCSVQQIDKGNQDCATILISSSKIKKQKADSRQQKRQQFDLFMKTAKSKVSDNHCTKNETSAKEIEHTWLAGTYVIVGDSIITGIDEKKA